MDYYCFVPWSWLTLVHLHEHTHHLARCSAMSFDSCFVEENPAYVRATLFGHRWCADVISGDEVISVSESYSQTTGYLAKAGNYACAHMNTHTENVMWTQRRSLGWVCKPRNTQGCQWILGVRRTSRGSWPYQHLNFRFSGLQNWGNSFPLFKPLSRWCFVTKTLRSKYTVPGWGFMTSW